MLAPDLVAAPAEPVSVQARLGYQPALDGLRTIAVLGVLLFHAEPDAVAGGYLGVDVFFVLSGFLITTLMVEEWRGSGTVNVLAFYGRRARRLFPALVLVLIGIGIHAHVLALGQQLRPLRDEFLATLAYASNWHMIRLHDGYFHPLTGISPLGHAWSLAVEEQWYLVWPLALLTLLRRGGRRPLAVALGVTFGLAVVSALWTASLAGPGVDPARAYYGTDARAHQLLLGSALALGATLVGTRTVPGRGRRLLDVAGVVGLGLIFAALLVVEHDSAWLYEGGMLGLSAVVGLVILAAVQPNGPVRRFLGLPPLRVVGLISYGLYLWHFPIYIAASAHNLGFDGTPLLLFRLGATAVAATASYVLVEVPVRRRQISGGRLAALLLVGTAVALGLILTASHEAPPDPTKQAAHAEVRNRTGAGADVYDPSGNLQPPTTPYERSTRLVITGDDIARSLATGYRQRTGAAEMVLWDQTMLGCSLFGSEVAPAGGPVPARCAPWRDDRGRWLEEFAPEVVAVLSGVAETGDRLVDGQILRFGSAAWASWFSGQVDSLLAEIRRSGARTAFLLPRCERASPGAELVHQQYRDAAQRQPRWSVVIEVGDSRCGGRGFTPAEARTVRGELFPRLAALRQG